MFTYYDEVGKVPWDKLSLEVLITNICFALWDSLKDNSIIEENILYARLVRK